jgi:hypothetical protein
MATLAESLRCQRANKPGTNLPQARDRRKRNVIFPTANKCKKNGAL